MKKIIYSLLIIVMSLSVIGCFNNKKIENNSNNEVINSMIITINDKEYNVELEDNDTNKELNKLLPLTITMNELNGNEKYTYLDKSLPTDSYNPNQINKGDIMLFGDNCLVLFYKTFNTNYSYTKIGHIDNLQELDNNNIKVKFTRD